MPTAEQRLKELGLTLPKAAAPVANYVPWVRSGDTLYLAGQVSRNPDGQFWTGKLGANMTAEQGYQAARATALSIVAILKAALSDLDKVKRIVRLTGMVNSTADFTAHPQVMNGASDLFVELFGDSGRHARSAVGVASLPGGVAIEIEATVEVIDSEVPVKPEDEEP